METSNQNITTTGVSALQKISNPSQSDGNNTVSHHELQIPKQIDQAPKKYKSNSQL